MVNLLTGKLSESAGGLGPVLVVGATSNLGTLIVEALLAQGRQVIHQGQESADSLPLLPRLLPA